MLPLLVGPSAFFNAAVPKSAMAPALHHESLILSRILQQASKSSFDLFLCDASFVWRNARYDTAVDSETAYGTTGKGGKSSGHSFVRIEIVLTLAKLCRTYDGVEGIGSFMLRALYAHIATQ